MEQVHECQSPLFLAVEVDRGDGSDVVHVFFDAPRRVADHPRVRGHPARRPGRPDAAAEVLAVPDDAPYRFGLAEAVSPLRLRGMVAMLARIKRQVRARTAS